MPLDTSAPIAYGPLTLPHDLDTTDTHVIWDDTSGSYRQGSWNHCFARLRTTTGGGLRANILVVNRVSSTRDIYLYFIDPQTNVASRLHTYTLPGFSFTRKITYDIVGLPPNGILELRHGHISHPDDFVFRIDFIYAFRGQNKIFCEYLVEPSPHGIPSTIVTKNFTFSLNFRPLAARTIRNAASAGKNYIGD